MTSWPLTRNWRWARGRSWCGTSWSRMSGRRCRAGHGSPAPTRPGGESRAAEPSEPTPDHRHVPYRPLHHLWLNETAKINNVQCSLTCLTRSQNLTRSKRWWRKSSCEWWGEWPGGDDHRVNGERVRVWEISAPTHGTGAEVVAATGSWSVGGGVVVVVLLLVGLLQARTCCHSTATNEQIFFIKKNQALHKKVKQTEMDFIFKRSLLTRWRNKKEMNLSYSWQESFK